ncbi:plant intracellular ras group-related LRR 9 [Striga asiatica]|uniref:Plant intracellular ras group-related LRR 9 n=1 Tax=Striga asiatica TaxID=4170 RepID=A0A5A7PQ20_STRAF|nr:plant intracellular ras group-related LRR 9 [Striga asiatica]
MRWSPMVVESLEEMHAAYEKMLSEAEKRLAKIYEAPLSRAEAVEEKREGENGDAGEEEIDEEVVVILKEAESGDAVERVDLCERRLRILPEAFERLKSLVVLNWIDNHLEVRFN